MAGGLDAACNESSFVGREVFGAEATDRVRTFHSALLPATLRNAFRTDFYQQLWHGIDLDGIEPDQLHVLPVVGKSAIRAAGDAARIRNGLICDEVFTSGTTGTPLVTVRGNREQAYIREFFTTLIDKDPPSRWRRGLQIRNPYHGHQVAIPAPVHFHSIGIYDAGSFAHGRAVLAGPAASTSR